MGTQHIHEYSNELSSRRGLDDEVSVRYVGYTEPLLYDHRIQLNKEGSCHIVSIAVIRQSKSWIVDFSNWNGPSSQKYSTSHVPLMSSSQREKPSIVS